MSKRKNRSRSSLSHDAMPVSPESYQPPVRAVAERPMIGDVRPPGVRQLIRRNASLIGVGVGLAAIVGLLVIARLPRRYEASVSIRVDPQRSNVSALGAFDAPSGNAMATELEMLRSRSLIRAVVDSTGFRLQLTGTKGVQALPSRADVLSDVHVTDSATPGVYRLVPATENQVGLYNADRKQIFDLLEVGQRATVRGLSFRIRREGLSLAPFELTVLPTDDAVDSVLAWTTVSRRSREADMLDVRVHGSDASLVRDVANTLGRLYVADHDDARRVDATHSAEFLRDQVKRVSKQLHSAEQNLRDYRSRAGVISLRDEAATGVSHRAELLAQRNAINAEREALDRLVRSTTSGAGDQYRHLIAFPTLLRSDAAVGIQSALIAAEQKRSELTVRQAERDGPPELKAVDARIADLRGQLRAFVSTYLQGLTNEVEALDATLSRSDQALATLPEKELRYAELDRQAKTSESLFETLQQKLKQAEYAAAAPDASIRLVDAAVLPTRPAATKPLVTMMLAIAAGLLVGLFGAFLREYGDRSLRTRSQLLALTGSPVLSLIPRLRGSRRLSARLSPARYATSDLFGFAESYARLVTNLGFAATEHPVEVLLVTSAVAGDGKTTVATNLALTLAREGKRVLLVDGDLRGGHIGGMLGLPSRAGLGETLLQQTPFAGAIDTVSVGPGRDLYVLARGNTLVVDPPALLASDETRKLIAQVRGRYDMVVVDTPPLNSVADAAMLMRHCDGVLLVARAGTTGRDALVFAMEQLRIVRAPVIGGVLNDVDLRRDAGVDGAYAAYGRYASSSVA